MTNNNTIQDKDIQKKVEELKENLLRDIEKIHRSTYDKVKEIMSRQDVGAGDDTKKDLKA